MGRQHGYLAWVAKSASWYMNGSLKMQHLVCVNGSIFPNFPNFEPKLDQMYTWILNKFILNKIMGFLSHNQCYDYCEYECFVVVVVVVF